MQLSPSEYYEFVRKAKRHRRQRAVGHLNTALIMVDVAKVRLFGRQS